VLITGASGGIGSALAQVYAAPGTTLVIQGRNRQRLSEVAAACEQKGARTLVGVVDMCRLEEYQDWLRGICDAESVDLAIVNAGVNTNIGRKGEGETWQAVRQLLDVNVTAAMATVHGVLPAMRTRRGGQIALMSSLAGYFGLPVTPTYCASKAAIKAYGEALRGWLAAENVRVNVIMPGYVQSQMCDGMPGPKPFLWSPARAAQHIQRGLARDRPRISFPFPLNLGTWLLAVLPPAVSLKILRRLDYGG
jgi:short-subunit dehydrogenase